MILAEGGLRTKGNLKKSNNINPLVSIVTVVLNGEKYLESTIQSIVGQSYENMEYIIVDGGSSDKTINIIKNNGALNKDFEPQFQSSLTYLNIEEILNNDNCSLTPYSESKDMHLSFLPILKKHFEQLMGKNLSHCPIT